MSGRGLALSGSEDFSHQSLDRTSRTIQREASREVARAIGQGLVTHAREECRAALASTALQNVGALSALEQHLIEIAPMGAARYQAIVDAYAIGAADTIARW
jgi:hypothetical protein